MWLLALLGCTPEPARPAWRGAPGPAPGAAPAAPIGGVAEMASPASGDTDHSGTLVPPPTPMDGFSFVDATLAGMPYPDAADLPFLATQGLSLVVTLTEEPLDASVLAEVGAAGLHLPVPDYEAPTPAQQDAFVAAVAAERAAGSRAVAHCAWGLGRTGTMLATWFVAEGASAEDAIAEVRRLRPGSIESAAQEAAVVDYAARIGR